MNESEKMSIATLIYVAMRRQANRIIDVEWMLCNETYAREVIVLARKQGAPELQHYAERMEEAIFGKGELPHAAMAHPASLGHTPNIDPVGRDNSMDGNRYVGTLR